MRRQTFDAGYLERLARADRNTEQDFAEYFGELLALKLRGRLRAPEVVADVIQETLLRVIKAVRRGGIDSPAGLGSFVNTTCNNVLFEIYRQESRFCDPLLDEVTGDAGPEQALATAEEQQQVRVVLGGLPEKDREILQALFLEERDKSEICRSMGVTREYLRVLLHRAKSRFREAWLQKLATKAASTSPLS